MKNVMALFEKRVNDIFSHSSTSSTPIQFKRLAKKTIREMENETFVIDGIDTAPALYTILVSTADDQVMRPLYINLTEEVSSLVEAQAKKRGYSFVGKPLVRFMIDPGLKQGKYAVFAENIDPRTLARLRDEENAFLGISAQDEPVPDEDDLDAGLTRIPDDTPQSDVPRMPQVPSQAPGDDARTVAPKKEVDAVLPAVNTPIEAHTLEAPNVSDGAPEEAEAEPAFDQPEEAVSQPSHSDQDTPEAAADSTKDSEERAASVTTPEPAPATPTPKAKASESPSVSPKTPPEEAPTGTATSSSGNDTGQAKHVSAPKAHPTCTLTDQETGRVYTISSDRTPIGRERTPEGIVLRDPNVSRRHAELTFDGHEWHITDLHSTNGTLVNDIDIDECSLRDGDVITIGLLNFVFREN